MNCPKCGYFAYSVAEMGRHFCPETTEDNTPEKWEPIAHDTKLMHEIRDIVTEELPEEAK